MTNRTFGFTEEDLLTFQFRFSPLLRVDLPVNIKLRSWGKIQKRLKLSHEMNLTAALQYVYALLGCYHRISIKIGCSLLKFREVLNTL